MGHGISTLPPFTSSSLGKWFCYRCRSESKGCLLKFLGSGVLDQRPRRRPRDRKRKTDNLEKMGKALLRMGVAREAWNRTETNPPA